MAGISYVVVRWGKVWISFRWDCGTDFLLEWQSLRIHLGLIHCVIESSFHGPAKYLERGAFCY
jgi:hypothetical protein